MTDVVDLTEWDGVAWPWPPPGACKRKRRPVPTPTLLCDFDDSPYWNAPVGVERAAKRRRAGGYDEMTADHGGYWESAGTYQDVFNSIFRKAERNPRVATPAFRSAFFLYAKFHTDGNADVVGSDGNVRRTWVVQLDRAIQGAGLNAAARSQLMYALQYGDRSRPTAVLYEQLLDAVLEATIN